MKIKLEQLKIKNFKRLKKFVLKPAGNVIIKGENATGKTSVADAFFWLISGNDSESRVRFNLIPLDQSGDPIDHVSPDVEAVISFGEKKINLQKKYSQIWTKKRGQSESEFTGHTTDHFFDDVPVSKREYETKLNEIIDLKLFRSLADIHYFCSQTDLKYRRQILNKIVGTISDEQIIKSSPELQDIPKILGSHTVDDAKKIIMRNKKEANDQLKELPYRIDEKKLDRTNIGDLTIKSIDNQIAEIDRKLNVESSKLAGLSHDVVIANKQKKISDLMLGIDMNNKRIRDKNSAELNKLGMIRDGLIDELSRLKQKLTRVKDQSEILEYEADINQTVRNDLQTEYDDLDSEIYSATSVCFNCGQSLPESEVELQEEKWKARKAAKLKDMDTQGYKLYAHYLDKIEPARAKITAENQSLGQKIEHFTADSKNAEASIILKQEDMQIELRATDKEAQDKIDKLTAEIEAQGTSTDPERQIIKAAIDNLLSERGGLDSQRLQVVSNEKIDRRINQLQEAIRKNSTLVEQAERELYLIELFSRKKADYIEASVSDYFSITQWKLFEYQVNKGLREICEATMDGVPYSTDLNTGARVNIGIDIINTLSKHYTIFCPIFIDNAESVTEFIATENQTIKLFAIDGVKKLKVEDDKNGPAPDPDL